MGLLKYLILSTAVLFSVTACQSGTTDGKENGTIAESGAKKDTLILIETDYGNMKFKLYTETPKHRENIIKLVQKGYYDGLLFHRVINEFMIQGGDPDSKNAPAGKMLGNGGPGYEIDAEFRDSLFHKKGVIAAAREGDDINPLKKSSGSQFYIVQGRKFTDEELNRWEEQISERSYMASHPEVKEQAMQYRKNNDKQAFNDLMSEIRTKEDYKPVKIPEFKRKVYKTLGGTPHLDGSYTVFGELVDGFDVLDKIALVKTDKNNRPVEDVKMSIKVIVE